MRFRRLAVSVVVTDLAGTTAQADIAHATTCEASLRHARALDVAVGANLALASPAERARHAASAIPWSATGRAS